MLLFGSMQLQAERKSITCAGKTCHRNYYLHFRMFDVHYINLSILSYEEKFNNFLHVSNMCLIVIVPVHLFPG